MSFLARLGLSLLIFGAITLVSQAFGYAPRKLANLSPSGIRAAGIAFLALGGLFLALGGSPKARKYLLVGLGSLAGLAVLLVVAALLYGRFGGRSRSFPAPPPPPAWTSPPAPGSAGPGEGPRPGQAYVSPMMALHEKRRAWETQYGREKVWTVLVHLAGKEPPADFEARLQKALGDGVAVVHTGGTQEAVLAPLTDAGPLRQALVELFPAGDVRVIEPARRVVVMLR